MGKLFVRELAHLFLANAEGTTLESITFTAAMTMPSLLLQKPHRSSKVKEHIHCLECRLKLWTEGDLDGLLREGRTIQRRLPNLPRDPKSDQQLARSFAKLMMEGKIRAALCLISRQNGGPPLALVACRLIALNKCPGVRPIGIREVVRRILDKVILATIGKEIQDAAGALQVCAGQQAECEAVVHGVRKLSMILTLRRFS